MADRSRAVNRNEVRGSGFQSGGGGVRCALSPGRKGDEGGGCVHLGRRTRRRRGVSTPSVHGHFKSRTMISFISNTPHDTPLVNEPWRKKFCMELLLVFVSDPKMFLASQNLTFHRSSAWENILTVLRCSFFRFYLWTS